ncbi:cytochrome C [Verrucomicrobia bacterium LW23]|nr:cytochrome C [Verrucomicrobia bacterium LW23]
MANIFPRSANWLPLQLITCIALLGAVVPVGLWYYFTPKYTRVGYMPNQPVDFSHRIHVGQVGLDCRYCHSFVEKSSHSNVPTTQTCMNCHSQIQAGNPRLQPVRDSFETGTPIKWVKIHQAPDYVYFNHSVHIARGVSCVSCHGKVNEMPVVWHDKSQSMKWCLDCHRDPGANVRPVENVFNLDWAPQGTTQRELGDKLVKDWKITPPTSCQGCHR